MNFDIPLYLEKDIEQFAQSKHISQDEAISQILQLGLERIMPVANPRDILGAFSSEIESQNMDLAIDLVMKDRESRSHRSPHE